MRFPEQLYRQGQVVRELLTLFERATGTGTTASITVTLTNPDQNYAWIITHALVAGVPEGGEIVNNVQIFTRSPATDTSVITYALRQNDTPGAATTRKADDWQGEIILLPSWRILGSSTKNLAVANQTVNLSVIGYRVPLGNINR